jgi:PilZ domain
MRQPEEKDVITVSVPELEELVAVVEEAMDDALLVELVKAGAEPLPQVGPSRDVVIRHETPLGIFEARGSVTPRAPGGRKLEFQPDDDPSLIQRREHARVEADLAVTLVKASDAKRLTARTVNVSGGGVMVRGASEIEVGDRVRVVLWLDDGGRPLETPARVVRDIQPAAYGLLFDLIDEPARERLIRYVFERQREQLRQAREGLA